MASPKIGIPSVFSSLMAILGIEIVRIEHKSHTGRPAQLAELPRSVFDPELFPHSAYVKFFVTFATKVPYLTFCDKM